MFLILFLLCLALRVLEVLFGLFIHFCTFVLCVCVFFLFLSFFFLLSHILLSFCLPFYTQPKRIRLWHCKRQHSNEWGWDWRCIWYVENPFSFFMLGSLLVCRGCHNRIPDWVGSNNRNVFSHIPGGWKSKIKVLAGLVFPEASLLTCRWLPSSCVLPWPVLCARTSLVSLYLLIRTLVLLA